MRTYRYICKVTCAYTHKWKYDKNTYIHTDIYIHTYVEKMGGCGIVVAVVVVVVRSGCATCRNAEGKADRTLAPWRDHLPQ